MPALTYRRAQVGDIPAILTLVTAAYRGDDSRQGWTTEAELIDGHRVTAEVLQDDIMQGDRLRHDSTVLLADADDELVGCAHIAHDGDGTGYFGMFAVRPDEQGAGYGKAILAEAERRAVTDWQITAMHMTVINLRQELIAFYQRRGYRLTGQFKEFPYGDDRFGTPKRDDLRLEVLEKQFGPA